MGSPDAESESTDALIFFTMAIVPKAELGIDPDLPVLDGSFDEGPQRVRSPRDLKLGFTGNRQPVSLDWELKPKVDPAQEHRIPHVVIDEYDRS